jgi:hypothetical protein
MVLPNLRLKKEREIGRFCIGREVEKWNKQKGE